MRVNQRGTRVRTRGSWLLGRGRGRRLVSAATVSVTVAVLSLAMAGPGFSSVDTSSARRPTTPGTVVTFPGPGWRTVSPTSTITFRGVTPSRLGSVKLVGSRSGPHPGKLTADGDGRGATFRPASPFRPGERVSVTSAVRVVGATSKRFSFTVATPVRGKAQPFAGGDDEASSSLMAARSGAAYTRCNPVRPRFHSRPALRPEGACVTHAADHIAPGLLLTTPNPTDDGQHGPTIYDNHGQVVWYQTMPYKRTWNLSVVTYHGERLLAVYVQGPRSSGLPDGQYLLLNRHYQVVEHIAAANGYLGDLHELQITPDGNAYIGAYHSVDDPVTGQPTTEYIAQEVDIATGSLLFEWHSLDHVPTQDSLYPQPTDPQHLWDYFHGNAISPLPDGNLLLSARNTSTVYEISRQTGEVLWRMGGKEDDFNLVSDHPDWQFCFQHDVRRLGDGLLSVFDNGGDGPNCPRHPARVEVFSYDVGSMTVSRVTKFSSTTASRDGAGYFARALGDGRRLINNDWLVSWGVVPRVTEFGSTGQVKWGMALSFDTYRVVRGRWAADPLSKPALAAQRDNGVVTAWASWNGATKVGAWRLLAGASPDHLHSVTQVGHHGFETRLRARTSAKYVVVEAIDRQGHPLARSVARRPS